MIQKSLDVIGQRISGERVSFSVPEGANGVGSGLTG